MLNTCKSNGASYFGKMPSGERVSNTWATCPSDGDNIPKGVLIPDVFKGAHASLKKGGSQELPLKDGPASD